MWRLNCRYNDSVEHIIFCISFINKIKFCLFFQYFFVELNLTWKKIISTESVLFAGLYLFFNVFGRTQIHTRIRFNSFQGSNCIKFTFCDLFNWVHFTILKNATIIKCKQTHPIDEKTMDFIYLFQFSFHFKNSSSSSNTM